MRAEINVARVFRPEVFLRRASLTSKEVSYKNQELPDRLTLVVMPRVFRFRSLCTGRGFRNMLLR